MLPTWNRRSVFAEVRSKPQHAELERHRGGFADRYPPARQNAKLGGRQ
jgi:hypothetical protein